MKKEDLELAKQEFNRDRDRWTDLLLTRRFYYADLLLRVGDRQVNHTLTLTTIAVGILSIVFPLVTRTSLMSTISFLFLASSASLGTGLVLYTIFRDKKDIPLAREQEVKVYSKFQSAANQNYSKAYSGALTWEDVKKYYDLRGEVEEDLSKTKGNKILDKIVDIFYISFLIFFFLGLASFFITIFCFR